MYKHIAKSYNELHQEEQLKKLAIIKQNIKIIPPLLDIGCGTGISTNYFAELIGMQGVDKGNAESWTHRVHKGNAGSPYVGVDNCKEMLAEGKKQYHNLQYASAEKLPFTDNSFSTIISVTAFHNFKNMEKALKEIKRVSRNNNIAISFLKKSKKLNSFRNIISKYYKFKEVEEEKDVIFIIRNKKDI